MASSRSKEPLAFCRNQLRMMGFEGEVRSLQPGLIRLSKRSARRFPIGAHLGDYGWGWSTLKVNFPFKNGNGAIVGAHEEIG